MRECTKLQSVLEDMWQRLDPSWSRLRMVKREPVPVPDPPLGEEPFPNIHPEPSLS